MSTYKSRKQAPRQPLIMGFFSQAPAHKSQNSPVLQPKQTKTPEKKAAPPADTRIAQLTQKKSAFDEFGSSDTLFGSPEVLNFRNPVLNRFSSTVSGLPKKSQASQQEPLFVSSDSEEEKENTAPAGDNMPSSPVKKPQLKRAGSSNVFDILDGQPRKALKKPSQTRHATPPPALDMVILSEEQRAIVNAIVSKGESVFFTGSAGTGKSVVLRFLVGELRRKHGHFHVGVTASTGLAACNISGQTVHKFLSIGLGTGSPHDLAMKIKRNGAAKKKWASLAVLVIDEISMIDGKLFTKIDEVAKIIRNNQRPFGGIQVVCSGDFYQLPPVSMDNTAQYCFQSPSWIRAIKRTFILTRVFRQKGDNELISMLNALRDGSLDPAMIDNFHKLRRKVIYTDGIEPTELFPTRQEVKRANESRLHQLPGRLATFMAMDNDKNPQLKRLFENLMCEERLDLKEGAQVMYLKNHPESTVVNGSIGTVIGFLSEDQFARLFAQCHALNFINPTSAFLTLVRLYSGLIGKSEYSPEQRAAFDELPEQWKAKMSVLAYEAFNSKSTAELLPVVNFRTNTDFTMILVRREEFTVDQGRAIRMPNAAASENIVRRQVPLLLAWAMSIHKAQGQSIDRLRVDLRRTFEKGQVYVALSRATNKEHLEVLNFDHRRITVSSEVKEFYRTLTAAA